MKPKIDSICIEREINAFNFGFTTNTKVFFFRGKRMSFYQTSPLQRSRKPISDASVLRAKRAMNAIVERGAAGETQTKTG